MTVMFGGSITPGWADCALREASKHFRAEIAAAAGEPPRMLKSSVGAAIGSAAHKAIEILLKHKRDTGEVADWDLGFGEALDKFGKTIEKGCEWDATTPDEAVAHGQIEKIVRVYTWEILPYIEPLLIEETLEADVGDGFQMYGHPDLYTMAGCCDDLKTGARDKSAQVQFGSYSLLLRANGYEVTRLRRVRIRRVGKTMPAAMPEFEEYDIAKSEAAARVVIDRIKADYQAFQATGKCSSFLPNPNSENCSRKYCSAFGTGICALWRDRDGL